MKCPRCGTQIIVDRLTAGQAITCPGCGSRLQRKKPSAQTQQLKQLLFEITQAYPDRVVDMSRWDHDRWDDRIASVCAQLGCTNLGAFLQAYGFQVLYEHQSKEKPRKRKKSLIAAGVICAGVLAAAAIGSARLLTRRADPPAPQMQATENAPGGSTSPEQAPQAAETVSNEQKYRQVFDAYFEACSMGASAYREAVWNHSGGEPYFPNCVDAIGYGYYEGGYPLYYAYFDINEDGTDELFLSQDNGQRIVLLDGYTYDGGSPVKLFPDVAFGSRTELVITDNYELLVTGSSGADNPSAAYYLLPRDSCLPEFSHGYCSFSYAGDYPGYTAVDISDWASYVNTTGIHLEFSWTPL